MQLNPLEILTLIKNNSYTADETGDGIDSHDANGRSRFQYALVVVDMGSGITGTSNFRIQEDDDVAFGTPTTCTKADGTTTTLTDWLDDQVYFFVIKRTKRYVRALLTVGGGDGECCAKMFTIDNFDLPIITASPIDNS